MNLLEAPPKDPETHPKDPQLRTPPYPPYQGPGIWWTLGMVPDLTEESRPRGWHGPLEDGLPKYQEGVVHLHDCLQTRSGIKSGLLAGHRF